MGFAVFFYRGRDCAVEGVGDGAGDAGDGVAVATKGDGFAEGVFEVCGIEEGDNGFGDGALAADIEFVGGADGFDGAVEIVGELGLEEGADFFFGLALPRKKDGGCDGLGSLDAVGVVVGDFGTALGFLECPVEVFGDPSDGAGPHGGAVAPAVVGLGVVELEPLDEGAAVAGIWVEAAELLVGLGVGDPGEEVLGGGEGENGVVGEGGTGGEDLAVFGLVVVVLVGGASDVAYDCAEHLGGVC